MARDQQRPEAPVEATETIFVPHSPGDSRPLVAILNGRKWELARGQRHEVPASVAEMLRSVEAAG
jgi:hypothetical protein